MNAERLIVSLDRFGRVLPAVVADVSAEDARWKPAGGAWSILEVARHLVDEEVEDFRKRLESTLRDPNEPWAANDPERWAVERKYNDGELGPVVRQFVEERRKSVAWLRGLVEADWRKAHIHPQFGPLRAGDLLTSWAAHDALHLRQVAKRLFQIAERDGGEFQSRYAGEWKA